MPWPRESLSEQLKSWKEVVQTCGLEGNKASPSQKENWEKAQQLAKQVVEQLEGLVKLEKQASKAFHNAQMKKAQLKLVSNSD